MNELDYLRDNRLRLWFIARTLPKGIELMGRDRETAFLLRTAIEAISPRAFPPPVSLSQVNFAAAGGSGGPDHTPSEKLVSACNPPSGSVESPGLVSSSGLRGRPKMN
jgi:hypothetical protein